MINQAEEIGSVMNLILDGELNLPPNFDGYTAKRSDYMRYFTGLQFPANFPYTTATLEDYEPYFRGRVSYVRALDTGAVPTPQGETLTGEVTITDENGNPKVTHYQTKVYPSEMIYSEREDGTPFGQAVGYQKAYQKKLAVTAESSFNHPERQASIFVFPDDSYGSAGFNKYVKPADFKVIDGVRTPIENENFLVEPTLAPYLAPSTDPDDPSSNLRILSCVFAEIVNLCEQPNSGNFFVYCDYVEFGAIMLGLAFQARGYEKFDEASSIFTTTKALGPVCPSKGSDVTRVIKEEFKKPKKRYTLLTSKMVESHFDTIMEAFNSYENRHGDIIKVLIGSPKSRDGINLANVLQVHISTAGWTPSATYQALSRAIRATSHVDLIAEKRDEEATTIVNALPREEYEQRLREIELEGFTGDLRTELIRRVGATLNIRIPIKTYKHAPYAYLNVDGQEKEVSISMDLYRRSEEKEIEIQRVMRIAKQCAIDCKIHYARNVRPGDVDDSPECDYDKCDYGCVDTILGRPMPPRDTETYDVYYADTIIARVMQEIKEIFTYNFSIEIKELYRIFERDNIRSKFVDGALEKLIREKTPILDRYGYISYLRVDGPLVYLVRDYPVGDESGYPLNEYVSHLTSLLDLDISVLTKEYRRESQEEIIEQIKVTRPDDIRFDRLLDSLDEDARVSFIEETLRDMYLHDLNADYAEGIEQKYANFIYRFNEPLQKLAEGAEIMRKIPQKQGKKPTNELKSRMKQIGEETADTAEDTDTDFVYVHILSSGKGGNVAYNDVTRYNKAEGKIRILAPGPEPETSNAEWRDTRPIEDPIYRRMIQDRIAEKRAAFQQFSIYGILKPDGNFLIRNRANERSGVKDDRGQTRGRECQSFKKPALIDVLWSLQIPSGKAPPVNGKERLIQYLLKESTIQDRAYYEAMDEEQLRFYAG